MLIRQPGWLFAATAGIVGTNDQIDVDVHYVSSGSGAAGVIFDVASNLNSYYAVFLSPSTTQFAIYRRSNGSWMSVIGWTYTSVIVPGSSTNHLTVIRNQSAISVEVNHTPVASTYDSSLGPGMFGIVGETFSTTTNADVRFDNLKVTAVLPAPSTPTALPTNTPGPTPTIITSQAGDAVAYQINVAHDGYLSDSALNPPLVQKWSTDLGGMPSYPLISQGKVFVTVANGQGYGTQLYALDARSGAIVWGPVQIPGTYVWSNAAYDATNLYVVNFDGILRSFDAESGRLRWTSRLPIQYAFSSPPVAAQGAVYTGGAGSGGTVFANGSFSGSLLWTGSVQNGDNSSPALSDDGVFVSYVCPQAYKFSRTTGVLLWHYSGPCEGGGGRTSAYHGGRLYVRDWLSSPSGYILDGQTGALVGRFASDTIPAFAGNVGFYRTGNTLQATDLGSGSSIWTFNGDGSLSSAPIVVNDRVYQGSFNGNLYALDVNTGQVVWSTNVGGSIPGADEQNASPMTGLNAGDGLLVVPAGNMLVAYAGVNSQPKP